MAHWTDGMPERIAEILKKIMPDQTNQLVTIDIIASFCGVDKRRIEQLREKGIISSVNAKFDFLPTIRSLLLHYREQASGRRTPGGDAMEEEKLLKLAAERESAELKLRTMRGELHHTRDVEKVFGAVFTRLRTGLLSLPQGVAPLLLEQSDINTIADIIMDRLSRTLTELSSFDFETFAANGGSEYIAAIEEIEAEDTENRNDESE